MSKRAVFVLPLIFALMADPQTKGRAPRKVPGASKPSCTEGAICFSGRVSEGEDFRKVLNDDLEFVLAPGWTITVVPRRPEGDCTEFASVINAPYRAHRDLYIDMSYGWTAEEEASSSPREFRFVTNCADYRIESERLNIVMWPYTATQEKADEALAKLGTSPAGAGRLWITDSKVSHKEDTAENKTGKIQSMSFTVEIVLPLRR
jgi:hypothetical protein